VQWHVTVPVPEWTQGRPAQFLYRRRPIRAAIDWLFEEFPADPCGEPAPLDLSIFQDSPYVANRVVIGGIPLQGRRLPGSTWTYESDKVWLEVDGPVKPGAFSITGDHSEVTITYVDLDSRQLKAQSFTDQENLVSFLNHVVLPVCVRVLA
jgi:hypothetical protein